MRDTLAYTVYLMEKILKKIKTIPTIRVSQDEYDAINEFKAATESSYSELLLDQALKQIQRGFKMNNERVNSLIGLHGQLTEKAPRGMTISGEIVHIYEPTPVSIYRVKSPYLYVHFLVDDEEVYESIGLWGFGNPLKIKGKEYFVDEFIVSTARKCLLCGSKLKRLAVPKGETPRSIGKMISSGRKFYRVCGDCSKKNADSPLEIELV